MKYFILFLKHFISWYIMVYGYHISYHKYANNVPAQYFVALYETKYNMHNYVAACSSGLRVGLVI